MLYLIVIFPVTKQLNSHWSLVIGYWSLVIGHWSLVIKQITNDKQQITNDIDAQAASRRVGQMTNNK
ncbi:MAG: hypothetical protein C6Y22_28930 [Hapalosiphonaceae cyanobacterium JJU2]|nr:MAG: hypothetical protein C6Y22_28930 [Hapalosiphonaceae cyanobacterium JJU2]